jgi:hypothetical protein
MSTANVKLVDAARNRLGTAQQALADALVAGAPTGDERARVEQAQRDLTAMLAQAAAATEQAEAARRQQVAETANAEARAAAQQVAARLREMVSIPVPSIELPAGIVAGVIEARARAAAAADAASAARARVTHLQARAQELEQRRAAITAKRQAGQGDDARDGAELALIQADSSGLSELLAQAVADAEGPTRQAEAAANAIAGAEQMWQQSIAQAEAVALAHVCAALEAALVEAATQLYPHRLSGTVQAWRAGNDLRHLFEYNAPRRVA